MNLAAVLYGKEDLKIEERNIPHPEGHDVLVQIKKCGICGTDMNWLLEGVDPQFVTLPVVMGHEASGVIEAVGPKVTNLKKGDRVALELGIPCRECDLCKKGKYNLCKPWSYGGLQKYHLQPADFCHKIADEVTMEEAALLEPLSVGVRAVKRSGIGVGQTLLVCGAGTIGLCSLLAAKATGVVSICVTDIDTWRLNLAKKFGATHTVLIKPYESGQDIAKRVIESMGDQVHSSIECCGVQSSMEAAIYATRSGGVVSPVALHPVELTLPLSNAITREVDIRGVFSYCNNYPQAIAVVMASKVSPSLMITHEKELKDIKEAIQLVQSRGRGVLKVMINCS